MTINQYSTLTFDCYGTLIDWESGIYDALLPLTQQVNPLPDRTQVLQAFAEVESGVQSEFPDLPYPEILVKVHIQLAKSFDVSATAESHETFGRSVANWPAFPDSAESLQYLKKYFKLVILSNVDRTGFSYSSRHLGVDFDAVYTAQDIGSYKPSPTNFIYMIEQLESRGISKDEILHTAQSLYHDMVPATEIGLATCWIDRRAGQEGAGATPSVNVNVVTDYRFESLTDMVAAHKVEISVG